MRTLWNWQHQAATSASESTRGRGRPPHAPEVRRKALYAVRREMRGQGKTVGEEAVLADLRALGITTSRRLVREQLAEWKRYDRRRAALRRERNARSIRPTGVGLMWSLDGAWIGRVIGRVVRAEIVLDVASLRTMSTVVAFTATAEEVILLLERAVVENGGPPVALFFDNGPENVNVHVVSWCRELRIVIVRNVPHTPQHNAWAEHRIGELKIESGLDAPVAVPSLLAAQMELERAVRVLDHGRRRRTLEFRTACEADNEPHVRYAAAQREEILARVDEAVAQARNSLAKPARARAVRRLERNACLKVLEECGVITITTGGRKARARTPAACAAMWPASVGTASAPVVASARELTPLGVPVACSAAPPWPGTLAETVPVSSLPPVSGTHALQGDLVSRGPTAGPAGPLDTKRTRSDHLDALRETGSPREESRARTSRGSVLAPTPNPAWFRFDFPRGAVLESTRDTGNDFVRPTVNGTGSTDSVDVGLLSSFVGPFDVRYDVDLNGLVDSSDVDLAAIVLLGHGSLSCAYNRLGYGGERVLVHTVAYLRSRTVDVNLGCWFSRDPLGSFADGPNTYGYCRQGPLRYLDPFGLKSDPPGPENGHPYAANGVNGPDEMALAGYVAGPIDALIGASSAFDASIQMKWEAYIESLGPSNGSGYGGDQYNAFLHCYWACLMCKKIPKSDAMAILEIHEIYNSENWKEPVGPYLVGQDMANNKIGCDCPWTFGDVISVNVSCIKCCKDAYHDKKLVTNPFNSTKVDIRSLWRKYLDAANNIIDRYKSLHGSGQFPGNWGPSK